MSTRREPPPRWRGAGETAKGRISYADGIVDLILKAVALGMSVASIVLGILNTASLETSVTLLSMGLLPLALAELQRASAD